MSFPRAVAYAVLATALGLGSTQVHAQPAAAASNGVTSFPASYFTEFQVSTAFDMVQHVPGFVFDPGESARGFSGTAGNVIIDGQRPTTKADLGNTLANINAAQVDHLELITGGAPGIDMHGHRQIVNVIRKKNARPNISLLGIYRGLDDRKHAGVLLFTFNDNRRGRSTDVTADIFDFFDNGAQNARRVTLDSDGLHDMRIHEHAGGEGMESQASHSEPLFGGKITFNGTYNPNIYRENARYIQDGDTGIERYVEKDTPSELGGQYERRFGHGFDLNLNLLTRHDRDRITDTYADSESASVYHALSLTNERILNGRLSWVRSDTLTLSAGTESAFNSLDRDSLILLGADSLPDHVRVQEDRTESFVSANWKSGPKLSLEGEVKIETSTISVPQSDRSDSFTYYKPRFQAVYTLSDTTKISWRTERQVDQLSFSGFASSVQLQTSHVTLGNTALVPQKDWLNSLVLEHSFWGKGAISLAYEHYTYADTSDFIAVHDGTDIYTANGNIGAATGDYLHLKLDTPLDRLKIPHGTLSVDWLYRQTKVTDPITGHDRRISGVEPHIYTVSFSQEFPKAGNSWGFDIESTGKDRNYLANEIDDAFYAPWTEFWFQHTTPQKLQFKITLKNPLNLRFTQDRYVYQELRGLSPITYTQHTTSKIPPIVEMRLKKDF